MRVDRLVAAVVVAAAAPAVLGAVLFAAGGPDSRPTLPARLSAERGITIGVAPVQVGRPRRRQRAVAALVTIGSQSNGQPVPDSFLGVSTEYGALPVFESHAPILDRVLSLLRPRGGGPLILRIGGNSADHTFWDPSRRRLPPWAIAVTPKWFAQLRATVRRVGARVILDLNLATATPQIAAQLAFEGERRLPHGSIVGFEVGNEPDLYDRSSSLARLGQSGVSAAAQSYQLTPDAYVGDFAQYAQALAPIAPGVPLVGPALAFPRYNLGWVATLLGGPHPGLGTVSAHLYPYTRCVDPGSPQYPTIARLLSRSGMTLLARIARRAVALARRAGLPLRLTELNSVSCGGLPGVSNTFATALWAPDALFELLRAGVEGVNVHIRAYAINGAFALGRDGLVARPLLYGLLLFARTVGHDAQLMRVDVRAHHALDLHAWAVHVGREVRVLVIDTSDRSANVHLVLAGAGDSRATVQRLLAPSVDSISGVTLDGQWLGRDGRWHGRPQPDTIQAGAHGYQIKISRFSAALVTIPVGGLQQP